MTADEANETEQGHSGRWRTGAAFLLAASGGVLIFYGLLLILQGSFAHWGWSKAAGDVVRIVRAEQGGSSAPVVVFADAEGRSHTVFMTQGAGGSRYATGDRIAVLYNPADPSQAVTRGFAEAFTLPLMLAAAGAALLLIAATLSSPPESLRDLASRAPPMPPDPARLQFHPFNAVSVKHYLAEAGAPDAKRKVKITEAAQALAQGRYPVVLAEFLSYASALAYRADAADYLARRMPRVSKPAQVEHAGARALMFLFEGHVVIAVAERDLARPFAQPVQLFQRRARPRSLVPAETVWDAAPRDYAPAAAWDGLREGVEAWLKSALPQGFDPTEHAPPRCLFTGHGYGGALTVLAAYEFAKRGRPIAAVVTFGAPHVAGKRFAEDYRELGLDARTLDVRARKGALPALRWPWSRFVPALRWTLPASLPQSAAYSASGIKTSPVLARIAHKFLFKEEAKGLDAPRPLFRAMTLRALSAFAAARVAILRHDLEQRYALPLTLAVLDRLGELYAADAPAAAAALSDHLLDIRGVRPADAHEGFLTLDGQPSETAPPSAPASH